MNDRIRQWLGIRSPSREMAIANAAAYREGLAARMWRIVEAVARRAWVDSYGQCQFRCGGAYGKVSGVRLPNDPEASLEGYGDVPPTDAYFYHTADCPAVEAFILWSTSNPKKAAQQ